MLKLKFMLVLVLLSAVLTVHAQTGKISGKVVDAATGEEITGAAVYLKGKMHLGTMTDFEGRFLIENIPFGSDTLVVSVLSMANFILPVDINSTTTLVIDVSLVESITEIETVVFKAKVDQKKMVGLYLEQKKLSYSINGLTSDAMKQIPLSNSGEALKLVSGATLQGGKFAIIRGLNERYNLAMINNSPLPSTEPEKRAFSLDLFPANMLDQLLIVKSATPEFPGDWAGGIILIRTKDVPDSPFFSVGMGTSYNSLTTFKPFQQTEKLKYDWLGLGSKARELPNGFPATQDIFAAKNTNRALLADYAKMLPNHYAFSETNALPNASLNVSGGRNYKIGKENKLGVIFSTLYGNSRSFKPAERFWWTTNRMRALHYTDSTYESDTRLGAMLNFTFKLGKNATFSLKNTYNHNGEDQFTKRSGARDAEGTFLQSFSYLYTYNRMFYTQLSGEHVFSNTTEKKKDRPVFDFASSTLNWEASYGNTLRNMPDYRNVEYQSQDPAEEPFRLKLLPQNGSEDVSRLFTHLNEDIKGLSLKLETPYEFNPMWSGSVKVGYNHQFKNRYFSGRFLSYSRPSTGFKFDLLQLPVGELFDASSFYYNGSSGPNGILMDEITRPYHSYFAQASLNAGFIQS
ncbi:MAG: carboxypeptidase-like regulatory domain-containing protein, partial [Bacteroidia bacterium]